MIGFMLLVSCVGGVLFRVFMVLTYFNLSMDAAIIFALIVVGLVKILSFYKSYIIFFRGNGSFLQIFLYFCALEAVPFSALCGGLVLMSHYLKINF